MNILVMDRSSPLQSAALVRDGGIAALASFGDLDCRSGEWAARLADFIKGGKIDRIVVGTGPGSFAGIRSALAFAIGYACGSGCEVRGIPSVASFAREGCRVAAVGDARRGKRWIALFDGFAQCGPVFQVECGDVPGRIPGGCKVVSPDHGRIGESLLQAFGERYAGEELPSADRLALAMTANPGLLAGKPLPIYLNPAVREP